jgi:hypothetical protein
MLHSVPAEVLSDRGKNFMSAAVKDFLDQLGAKKYETAPYKPSTNGSVERFHAYLASAMSHYVENEQETWDEFLDGVLFAYRTTPIDGLDISPFEVIYGRNPNLPIDNMLFRENYEQPINTLEEYMDALHEYQLNMCEVLQKARRERFERNKRNHGAHKGIPMYEIGDKVYLSFPKGHFRPLGKSTKLSPINDGPYTVLEKRMDGLVYQVQHDRSGYIHNSSVQRMIPVTKNIVPDAAVDLPSGLSQFDPKRRDRVNDVPARGLQVQIEADNEAKDNGGKGRKVKYDKDNINEDEDEDVIIISHKQPVGVVREKNKDTKKEEKGRTVIELKEKKKNPPSRLATQVVDGVDKPRTIGENLSREERLRQRELKRRNELSLARAKQANGLEGDGDFNFVWLRNPHLQPKGRGQVTPALGREGQVRLGTLPPRRRNRGVGDLSEVHQQWSDDRRQIRLMSPTMLSVEVPLRVQPLRDRRTLRNTQVN